MEKIRIRQSTIMWIFEFCKLGYFSKFKFRLKLWFYILQLIFYKTIVSYINIIK